MVCQRRSEAEGIVGASAKQTWWNRLWGVAVAVEELEVLSVAIRLARKENAM